MSTPNFYVGQRVRWCIGDEPQDKGTGVITSPGRAHDWIVLDAATLEGVPCDCDELEPLR